MSRLTIQLPFACNAQIIKDFLPIMFDKEGKVTKTVMFQRVKKACLLPGAATVETSLYL